MSDKAKTLGEFLADSPTNWGRWGSDDEIGSLNFLNNAEVLRGIRSVRQGNVFCLGTVIADPKGDVARSHHALPPVRFNLRDRSSYAAGKVTAMRGGGENAVDMILMGWHAATTHIDALGHPFFDDKIYNGYDANTTIDGNEKCSIVPIAKHGIIGRAILLDVARFKKVSELTRDDVITLRDLQDCAKTQNITIEKHDIVLLRTGWLNRLAKGTEGPGVDQPGLYYTRELAEFFQKMEIPFLGTDSLTNEHLSHPKNGIQATLHNSLIRNLGVIFNEILWLEELANDCASDGQWTFLFVCSPLKIFGGTGSPVNPVAIK